MVRQGWLQMYDSGYVHIGYTGFSIKDGARLVAGVWVWLERAIPWGVHAGNKHTAHHCHKVCAAAMALHLWRSSGRLQVRSFHLLPKCMGLIGTALWWQAICQKRVSAP